MQSINHQQYLQEPFSNETQELISRQPHWMVKQGSLIFLLIIMLLLISSWLVHFPDRISGSLKLEAVNAPKLLVAPVQGKLTKLLIRNEQFGKKNQPVAFLQSTGNHQQVLGLQQWIDAIETFVQQDSLNKLLEMPLPRLDNLGELQSDFQRFENSLAETKQILKNGFYPKKKQALLQDIGYLSNLKNNTTAQKELSKQDYELQQKEFNANEALARDAVIAQLELNQNKSKLISKKQNMELLEAQLINNEINEHQKRKDLLDLQKTIADQHQQFRSELYTLRSMVNEWIQKYIIVLPEAGRVLFSSFLQENQLLNAGQELFYVEPPQSLYYGQLSVSQNGFGKIKTGQRVIIRLPSFPSSEFGYITGRVEYISDIPSRADSFLIKVALPDGLNTNYKKHIYFRNSLIAEAEVLTDNRRLIERFWGQLMDIVNK